MVDDAGPWTGPAPSQYGSTARSAPVVGGARRTAFALLVTKAVLLAGTLPVLGFLAVWGSVWEGSPEVLARRRTVVHWIMVAGLGNAIGFVFVLLAAGEARRLAPLRWSAWAAGWVGLLGAGWAVALGGYLLHGPGLYWLLFTAPALIALVLLRIAARSPSRAQDPA